MKYLINIITLMLYVNCIYAQSQSFEWAKNIGGTQAQDCQASCITTDNQGNTYTSGYFAGTVDFDPGIGIYNLTANGFADAFVCKLNSNGNLLWAKHFGHSTFPNGIAVDANGNVFTTGFSEGLGDFNPGIGVYNLQAGIFISKLDSIGNFVWAKGFETNGRSYSITLDNNNNVLITGYFNNTADFDPGLGYYFLSTINNDPSIFVLKINSSGNFVWAKKIDGNQLCTGRCIRTDNLGDIYITGNISGTVYFDSNSNPISALSFGTAFVSKFDSYGNYIWARLLGGGSVGYGLAVDGSGNVYSTGNYVGIGDFNPSDSAIFNLVAVGSVDVYVSKLNSFGNFLWAKSIGGYGVDASTGIVLDALGNVYTFGYFGATADFDPGLGVYNIQTGGSGGVVNGFVSCLNSSGNYVWASAIGDNPIGNSNIYCIAGVLDNLNSIYTTGYFQGSWDFDQGPSVYNLTSTGVGNPYVTYINKLSYPKSLNLKLFLQGYYIGSNQMTAVLMNQGIGNSTLITDSITIELHGINPPYQIITSVNAVLNNDGTVSSTIHVNPGNYYIAVKHRNGITTWSAAPIAIGTTSTYDFTTASSKAYGDNMKQMQTGQWALYNGDFNNDENVDLLDISTLETDINQFQFGYFNTDLNGDGNIDLLDMPILEGNVNNFVYSNHP